MGQALDNYVNYLRNRNQQKAQQYATDITAQQIQAQQNPLAQIGSNAIQGFVVGQQLGQQEEQYTSLIHQAGTPEEKKYLTELTSAIKTPKEIAMENRLESKIKSASGFKKDMEILNVKDPEVIDNLATWRKAYTIVNDKEFKDLGIKEEDYNKLFNKVIPWLESNIEEKDKYGKVTKKGYTKEEIKQFKDKLSEQYKYDVSKLISPKIRKIADNIRRGDVSENAKLILTEHPELTERNALKNTLNSLGEDIDSMYFKATIPNLIKFATYDKELGIDENAYANTATLTTEFNNNLRKYPDDKTKYELDNLEDTDNKLKYVYNQLAKEKNDLEKLRKAYAKNPAMLNSIEAESTIRIKEFEDKMTKIREMKTMQENLAETGIKIFERDEQGGFGTSNINILNLGKFFDTANKLKQDLDKQKTQAIGSMEFSTKEVPLAKTFGEYTNTFNTLPKEEQDKFMKNIRGEPVVKEIAIMKFIASQIDDVEKEREIKLKGIKDKVQIKAINDEYNGKIDLMTNIMNKELSIQKEENVDIKANKERADALANAQKRLEEIDSRIMGRKQEINNLQSELETLGELPETIRAKQRLGEAQYKGAMGGVGSSYYYDLLGRAKGIETQKKSLSRAREKLESSYNTQKNQIDDLFRSDMRAASADPRGRGALYFAKWGARNIEDAGTAQEAAFQSYSKITGVMQRLYDSLGDQIDNGEITYNDASSRLTAAVQAAQNWLAITGTKPEFTGTL